MSYILEIMPQVLEGLKVTLEIFALTLILSIPLGVVIAVMRTSKALIVNKISEVYILIMRGTPLLLQIIVIFFGLPMVGITFDRFPAAILAFVLNYGAYFGEIFRAGIASIDDGQVEGAKVLGLSSKDTFFRIILPQAFKRVIPPVANEITTLVKDTSLVYVLGMDELLKIGKTAANRDVSLVPLLIVGVVYLIVIAILSQVLKKVEEKYDYYS
ncbi:MULTISPECIES: amino acid ABC transporter permease [Clostridium]|uniref:L-cystine transport system permease protein TcyB n=1 Tax=Clostridium saccharoperbutylacetonicum N1-4(HMT) TaxID=931276 RepID=M1MTN7_9CLOT|nr:MULTISPECIES: amino acid ABC transporter permease [Clostridium]AGF54917.1 L-cystine transport system permease protein TcyB [Clostridium saccharoperbutylacetonicum N1-4(HMT)]AQR93838.1 arginine transport system permease protein ArtQ [Clostridium saccharoperbutylacetonicum]NRT64378.1 polar amino acid transport system permease protein [Clostridium saccharoperbutylacetonicum]NSB27747.1 polar amino acid transport system permease protein [Clostridium saccharoperbutylacetonicum]NSB29538.1 polar am